MSDVGESDRGAQPEQVPAGSVAGASPAVAVDAAPRRSRAGSILLGVVIGGMLAAAFFGFVALVFVSAADQPLAWAPGGKVAVVELEGEIIDARDTIEELRRYADHRSVRAIVLRIDSPGGGIVPSQEIFSEIRRIRQESGKPVVASFDSVAASGGYYVAAACDRIVSNPGTITGSIGVIFEWITMADLLEWAKLKPNTVTSGVLKDAGSPLRDVSPEERAYFQSIVSQLHEQFIEAVATGRSGHLTRDEVASIADGRVVTGEQALTLKLVDQIGTLQDAIETAGRLAGIEGSPDVIYPKPREPGLLDVLVEAKALGRALESFSARVGPNFSYRW